MKKIRINELARELEVKPHRILELLPELGVTDKKTHSSSLDEEIVIRVRRHFGVAVEEPAPAVEPAPEPAAPPAPAPAPEVAAESFIAAEPEAKPELAAEPVPSEKAAPPAPVEPVVPVIPQIIHRPLRPPLATARVGSEPPPQPVVAAPPTVPPPAPGIAPGGQGKPTGIQPKPLPAPVTPKPGQILTGPRQPFPATPVAEVRLAASPPSVPMPAAPLPRPPKIVHAPARPAAAAPPPGAALAGQPAARPVVPPRPDLVARLAQAQPQPPRPGLPPRPPSPPVPGQPIYRGPIRPGQPLTARTGAAPGAPARGGRQRTVHPTSGPRLEPAPLVPADGLRREVGKKARTAERDREREVEEKIFQLPSSRRAQPEPLPVVDRDITIADGITVKELSEKLGVKANLVIKKLVERRIFATINQTLDVKLANEVAQAFGASTKQVSFEEEAMHQAEMAEGAEERVKRAPVVTIMGHVDHGKTSLLDAIRMTNVAEREAGGITQHIGAYYVEKDGRRIVFIDTPGHEAFTRMRARGAKVTDIVVLVVAADDGVMPQTLEAIDHARAAGVPIIVAINKIDKPDAQPERVKQQLADRGLLAEDWGGDTVMVPVSAKAKTNLDLLLEMILLVADMQELKASPNRPAIGTVLEAELDRGRGPVATVLVRNGTLRVGDHFICGSVFGRVRAMYDDRGQQIREAEPSMPVEVLGLESLPEVGDTFQVVTDTAKAKQIVMYREGKAREQAMSKAGRLTLDQLHEQLREGEVKELNIILKTDVGGTAEVLTDNLQKLSNDKVRIRVLHSGVGAITETDVLLASASNAIIIGFNVRPERNAATLAEQEKVDIRLHTIIYELTDEIKRAMTGMLEPVFREVYRGRATVQETFRISKVGTVAGCFVQDGVITRDSEVRLLRDNVVIYTGKIESLRRFKNDASEVKSGLECGIALSNFNDIKPGDVIEAFATERVAAEVLV